MDRREIFEGDRMLCMGADGERDCECGNQASHHFLPRNFKFQISNEKTAGRRLSIFHLKFEI